LNIAKNIVLTALAIIITAAVLWLNQRTPAPKAAAWEDVLVEAAQGGYALISTKDLWQRYQKNVPPLLLVDTRQEWEYRTGHIQGALNFSMEPTWLSRWRSRGALKELLGPDKNRLVVFY
jgi:hypothetical protein